ncbi:hypothetical protein [Bradyrhizobium hipponense]|uniref:hypothetical protein n=1 Tax=Bradyrhizobium hipponense TaxID=2605638 RepID=UPI0016530D84|nr:hypothetical protein [Bradyrhizobium hipponense]
MNYITERAQLRQSQLADLIEEACQHLEPSSYQREVAQQRYEGVGDWLSQYDDPLLAEIAIRLPWRSARRSSRLASPSTTSIWWRTCRISTPPPAMLKARIGDRLRANGHYAPLLLEMPRCWRLNYANEFHLDIPPASPTPAVRSVANSSPTRH